MTPDELEERIRDAMTGEQAAPRNELWERVMTRRTAGERVVLPVTRRQAMTRVMGIAAVAAALLLLLTPIFERRPAELQPVGHTPASRTKASAGERLFLPGALLAQASAVPAFSTHISPRITARPGTWSHGRFADGVLEERYEYTMSKSTLNGAPAWLVLSKSTRASNKWIRADSTWFSTDSLHPQLRITWVGEARFEQTYRTADILTGVTRNGYTSWSTTPQADLTRMFGGGSLFRPSEIGVRLQAMDLSPTWRGSIPLPASSEQPIASLWINLIVDGEDTLEVPAGTFDCWRIRSIWTSRPLEKYDSNRPPSGLYFWVSKDRQWLIKTAYVDEGLPSEPLVLVKGEEE